MSDESLLGLVARVASLLDDLAIPYAIGGSVAASLHGEPRSTADVDIAVALDLASGEALLEHARAEFYVPEDAARAAIRERDAFNLLSGGLKVDLFVLSDGLLDRRQIQRRRQVPLPGAQVHVWVTSPEDVVLRKLQWYRDGGEVSDRQWRDVVAILRVSGDELDVDDLRSTAAQAGLTDLLQRAEADAGRYE